MSESDLPLVVVVDDEPHRLELIRLLLRNRARLRLHESARDALESMDFDATDLVVSDVRMPEVNGLELLEQLRKRDPDLAVLLITSHASVEQAVATIKAGAYDYIPASFQDETLVRAVLRGVEHTRLARRARALEARLRSKDAFEPIIGRSAAMMQVFSLLESVRNSDITVLIAGESGTGKELVARALHKASKRAAGPFVPVNCGAIPRDLLESELFGHVRGAFTGAVDAKPGLIERAEGGTFFLDEVSELPAELQVKLNRFLQEGEIRRVGAVDGRRVDVRVIAATNRDLEQDAAAGRFRWDVFYRLNSYPIRLPPLRERTEDIPLLAHAFLAEVTAREGKPITGFEPDAMAALCNHTWPGNVRELQSVLARAVVLAQRGRIETSCLPAALKSPGQADLSLDALRGKTYSEARKEAADRVGREYLRLLLVHHRGDVRAAAVEAGLQRETFYALLKRFGIRPSSYRPEVAAG